MLQKIEKPFLIFISLAIFFAFFLNFNFYWQQIANLNLPDNDDLMRVLRVREWLNGAGFYDNIEHRSNEPIGASIHWSRIADLPLFLFQKIAIFFTSTTNAEILSIIFVPIFLGAIFIFSLGKVAYKFSNSKLSFIFALCLVPIFSTNFYNFQIGRVDHHGLQLICIIGILHGLFENKFKNGFIGGIALSLSIAIGFEALIIEAILCLSLFALWLLNGAKRKNQVYGFCFGLLIGIIFGFFINVAPKDYFINRNDFQSFGQTILIIFAAIYFALMAKFTSHSNLAKKLIFIIIGLFIGIILIYEFKEILKPVYGQISPILTSLWLNKIGEITPLWKLSLTNQMALLLPAILAITLIFIEITKSKPQENDKFAYWIILLILILTTGLMTFFYQNRFNIHFGLFISLALCATLPNMFDEKKQKIILSILLLILPIKIFDAAQIKPVVKQCNTKSDFANLAILPKGLIAANIDINVPILIHTNHNVMGTAFHRDIGKENIFALFTQSQEQAIKTIKNKKIDYIAICAKDIEIETIKTHYPHGFLSNLINSKLNDEFAIIKNQAPSDVIIYKPK